MEFEIPGSSWYGDVASIAAFAYAIGFTYDSFPYALVASLVLEIGVSVVRGEVIGWNFFIVFVAATLGSTDFFDCKLHLRMGDYDDVIGQTTEEKRKSADREFFLMSLLLAAQYFCCRLFASDATVKGFPCGLFASEAAFAVFALCELVVMELSALSNKDAKLRTELWICLCIGVTAAHVVGFLAALVRTISQIMVAAMACLIVPTAACVCFVVFFRVVPSPATALLL